MAILLLFLQGDPLREFEKMWDKPDRRVNAVQSLRSVRDAKVVGLLSEKLKGRIDEQIRETIFSVLAEFHHREDPEVARLYLENLPRFDRGRKLTSSTQFIFIGLASMSPKLTRPHVGKIHEWVGHPDHSLAAHAVRALGMIRNKDSVPVLIKRLAKVQKNVQEYMPGDKLKNCDGD